MWWKAIKQKIQVAIETPFDDTTCQLGADEVQGAIEALCDEVSVSASPGFSWGRRGSVTLNTWLLNEGVPSNRTGRTVMLIDPVIRRVSVANQNVTTYTLSFYEHDGNLTNLTLLGNVTVTAARGDEFGVNFPITQGKQLAVRLTATSGNVRNVVAGLIIDGDVA